MKQPTDSKCMMCYKAEKHIKHTVAGCTTLVPSEHTNRHIKVVVHIQWICKHIGLQITDTYYKHKPERVINANGTTIMWDIMVTD